MRTGVRFCEGKVKVIQSCLIICDPIDCIVHGILQARILEWLAIPFSRGFSQPRDGTQVFRIAGRFFTRWASREASEGKVKWSRSVMYDSLRPHGLWPTRLPSPWDFPGKNTGVGCHFLLQEIFVTQGLNLGLLHCKQILYCLSHQGRCCVK